MLSERYINLFNRQLKTDRAELYTTDPNGPDELYTDELYAQARDLRRLDLNSTGAQIVQRSGIAAPLVVLKLFLKFRNRVFSESGAINFLMRFFVVTYCVKERFNYPSVSLIFLVTWSFVHL